MSTVVEKHSSTLLEQLTVNTTADLREPDGAYLRESISLFVARLACNSFQCFLFKQKCFRRSNFPKGNTFFHHLIQMLKCSMSLFWLLFMT